MKRKVDVAATGASFSLIHREAIELGHKAVSFGSKSPLFVALSLSALGP